MVNAEIVEQEDKTALEVVLDKFEEIYDQKVVAEVEQSVEV